MTSVANPESAEIRELVLRSSEVIAHYWPMGTFVHHNPLASLENRNFDEAVRMGRHFVGGEGYLPNQTFRDYVESGRITQPHLDAALKPLAQAKSVTLDGRQVSHFDVLRAHLLTGITAPADETLDALINRSPHRNLLRKLGDRLTSTVAPLDGETPLGRKETLAAWCDQTLHTETRDLIDHELIKWCEAFLDEGHAPWVMPGREQGFYQAWKALASREWSPCGIANSRKKLAALPPSAEDALLEHLDALAIPSERRQDYLSLSLTELCGWASFINWRGEHTEYEWQQAHPIDLVQYLAVRLWYERELVEQHCQEKLGIKGRFDTIESYLQREREPADELHRIRTARLSAAWRLVVLADALQIAPTALTETAPDQLQLLLDWLDGFPETDHGPVWLTAFETGYREELIGTLRTSVSELSQRDDSNQPARPDAQAMFCIDVRSEPFRRNLESVGNYDTIGFAGFFTIFIQHRAHGKHHETAQFPAIVQSKNTVFEVAKENQGKLLPRHEKGTAFLHTMHELLRDLKSNALTPYITVEALGWIFGLPLIARTVAPSWYRKLSGGVVRRVAPPIATAVTVDKQQDQEFDLGFTSEEQATTIETALRSMGLVRNFARLVLVCGHGSTSDNNPYEAALDCGACGGNPGKPNARVFATMANKPEVRSHLAKNGIVIPDDTHFIAGLHDTTTDAVQFFDLEHLPPTHRSNLDRFTEDLRQAAIKTNRERVLRLPMTKSDPTPDEVEREISRRAGDWSETRPEWGLSNNAAFIIGRRELTRSINLGGRSFLNSYDYRVDTTGELLEGTLNGPQVVGQWINTEHYFSATDPEVYGTGSKIYHNVVGRFGIMSGPQSDLRTGLARQSVMVGDQPYHEPLRLLVVIEAPLDRISQIIERQPTLKQLYDNEWVHLVAIDHDSEDVFHRYQPKHGWTAISGDNQE